MIIPRSVDRSFAFSVKCEAVHGFDKNDVRRRGVVPNGRIWAVGSPAEEETRVIRGDLVHFCL